jgi:hypothetical protein
VGYIPIARVGSPLAGYQTTFDNQQHVIFIDNRGHVTEICNSGSEWEIYDLTELSGASPVPDGNGSPLTGYQTVFNKQQHINYIGKDGHVFELLNSGNNWSCHDLTSLAGSPIKTRTGERAGCLRDAVQPPATRHFYRRERIRLRTLERTSSRLNPTFTTGR